MPLLACKARWTADATTAVGMKTPRRIPAVMATRVRMGLFIDERSLLPFSC